MTVSGDRIKILREEKKLSQLELAERIGINNSVLSRIESGKRSIEENEINLFADFFEVSGDYILGRSTNRNHPYYKLTAKDEKDIGKNLERMLADLESNEALAFNGEPMDEETKRLFAISLENSLRLARELSKQKFTPNKYRD